MESVVEKKHIPLIDAEATQMLRDICVAPAVFSNHTKRFANSLIMSMGTKSLYINLCDQYH
jgi:hypothetical protein